MTSPAPYVPPDPEVIGVTRRQFFNRGTTLLMTAGLASFGAAVLGFLWYAAKGGFGGRINAGNLNDIKAGIEANDGFYYVPEARSWITAYPADALPNAEQVYAPPVLNAMQNGIAVLYQKCPHLGCRVPSCVTSQWFECPCHGSQYNQVGEKKGGPAPRGMDRFVTGFSGAVDTVTTTLTPTGPGTVTVSVLVTDSAGDSHASTRSITVAAAPSTGGGGGGALSLDWLISLALAVLAAAWATRPRANVRRTDSR